LHNQPDKLLEGLFMTFVLGLQLGLLQEHLYRPVFHLHANQLSILTLNNVDAPPLKNFAQP
jgi:hypothetical protein